MSTIFKLAAVATIVGAVYTVANYYQSGSDDNLASGVTPSPAPIPEAPGIPKSITTPTPQKPSNLLSGQWEFDVKIDKGITSSGSLVKRNDMYELVVQLKQNGNRIKGNYLAASNGMCGRASIAGWVNSDSVDWSVNYIGCGNIKKEFTGKIMVNGKKIKIVGNTTPISSPGANSWAGYEKMSGFLTKR